VPLLKLKKRRISNMTKVKALTAALVLVTLLGTFAQAEQCYKLDPFIDILRLSAVAKGRHTDLFGNWVAGTSYTLPIVGSKDLDVNGTSKRIGVHGTNNTADFGGNLLCSLDGFISGSWVLQCAGTTTPFATSGSSLTPVSCPPGKPREGGRVAGRQ
jgi:hypothetical protein